MTKRKNARTCISAVTEETVNIEHVLRTRNRERSDLLKRIVESLTTERSVQAAWLSGSVSRGNDDALSDLDIHIAIDDQAIDQVIGNRKLYASRPARPTLLMDNYRNAPAGGAYLLALYKGEFGPQHVDWFWQHASESHLPDDERILFDRVGLPSIQGDLWRREAHRSPAPPLGLNPSRADLLTHKITFFWAMCLIVAKYIARRNGVGVTKMTRVIARTLDEIAELGVLSGVPAEFRDSLPTNLADTSADARVNLLRELACHTEVLSKRLMAQGVAIPSEAVEQIYRFIYLAETLSMKPWGPYARESANTECASQ